MTVGGSAPQTLSRSGWDQILFRQGETYLMTILGIKRGMLKGSVLIAAETEILCLSKPTLIPSTNSSSANFSDTAGAGLLTPVSGEPHLCCPSAHQHLPSGVLVEETCPPPSGVTVLSACPAPVHAPVPPSPRGADRWGGCAPAAAGLAWARCSQGWCQELGGPALEVSWPLGACSHARGAAPCPWAQQG